MEPRSSASQLTRWRLLALAVLVGALAAGASTLLLHRSHAPSPRPGALTVFRADATRVADCAHGDLRCFSQAYGNVALRSGPRAALDQLQAQVAAGAFGNDCHAITHQIGRAAIEREHGSVGRAFAQGTAVCNSGYYHGVLIGGLTGRSHAAAVQLVRTVCDDATFRRNEFMLRNCQHGLGHGTMFFAGRNVADALALCDAAPGTGATICDGGVYMEYFSPTSGFGTPPSPAVAERVCRVASAPHKLGCYGQLGAALLRTMGDDWTRWAQICARAGDAAVTDECVRSMGGIAAALGRPAAVTAQACRPTGARIATCIYGASRSYMAYDASGRSSARLCAAAPASTQTSCYGALGDFFRSVGASPAQVATRCAAAVAPSWAAACARPTPFVAAPTPAAGS